MSYKLLYDPFIAWRALIHSVKHYKIVYSAHIHSCSPGGQGFHSHSHSHIRIRIRTFAFAFAFAHSHSQFKKSKRRNIHSTPLIMAIELPYSVETTLAELARKHGIQPANEDARKELAGLGEKDAMSILQKISRSSKIGNLTGFIFHMIKSELNYATLAWYRRRGLNFGSPSSCRDGLNCGSPTSLSLTRSDSYVSSFADGVFEAGATGDDELYPISGERRQTNAYADTVRRKWELGIFTEHEKALGKLDFPKAFLVLSYVTPYVLEEVLSVQSIQYLQGLQIADVESYLRQTVAMKANPTFPFEGQKFDWDLNKTQKYHCYVDCEGNCTFKGPFSTKKKTHLQRVVGDSNVLQVHFAEGLLGQLESNGKIQDGPSKPNAEQIKRFHKMAKEGIFVGLRLYQFFVFKDSGKESKKNPRASSVKCYFVCTQSFAEADRNTSCILFDKSIPEARCMFMHAHTVPSLKKYMARLSLILSNTICFKGDISNVEIKRIKDIPCLDENMNKVCDINGEPLIQTDGTGFISEDLASQCPMNIYKGKEYNEDSFISEDLASQCPMNIYKGKKCNEDSKVCPLLIQCRLFYNGCAVKGTLLVNRELPPKSIHIRDSMIKVEGDAELVGFQTINSLEICATSRKPRSSCLSRFLIALLNYGGVPRDFFIDLVHEAFDQVQNVFRDRRKALKAVKKHEYRDEYHMALRMLSCGIPLHEPFLQNELKKYVNKEIQKFKQGKVPLENSFYLMGSADPTGQLKSNEVCVILDHGQVCGKVLVYRHPGLHFGDIHVLKATYVEAIEKIVGDSKFAIFFSTQGSRSAADEIAKGDFDGDLFWVSMNADLLKHFKPGRPWERPIQDKGMPQPQPTEFSYEELEENLIEEFFNLRFAPSNEIGIAAVSWLAFMDRLLTPEVKDPEERQMLEQKMLKLTNIYYEALDAPKSGRKVEVPKNLQPEKKPHFLNPNPQDENLEYIYKSTSVLGKIYDQTPSDTGSQLKEIWTIPYFQDVNVAEFKALWSDHYTRYRPEMTDALKPADRSKKSNSMTVIQKYKQILYGATSLSGSSKSRQQVYLEACALYQVVYEYAKKQEEIGKCAFAWKVAGEALCEMYLGNQHQEHILISPSILYETIS